MLDKDLVEDTAKRIFEQSKELYIEASGLDWDKETDTCKNRYRKMAEYVLQEF